MNQIASQNRDVYEYTRSLLQEKEECLRAVKLQYQQNQTSAGDYLSCQRSLLQAIGRLQELMRKCDSNLADAPGEDFEIQPGDTETYCGWIESGKLRRSLHKHLRNTSASLTLL